MKHTKTTLLLTATLMLFGCTGTPPTDIGVQPNGKLAGCPDTPNCVSTSASASDEQHYIAPLALKSAGDWHTAIDAITALPRTELVESTDTYAYFRFTTRIMRYVDDLELHRESSGATQIFVRSASRLGKSDFGVNRERVEMLRELLQ